MAQKQTQSPKVKHASGVRKAAVAKAGNRSARGKRTSNREAVTMPDTFGLCGPQTRQPPRTQAGNGLSPEIAKRFRKAQIALTHPDMMNFDPAVPHFRVVQEILLRFPAVQVPEGKSRTAAALTDAMVHGSIPGAILRDQAAMCQGRRLAAKIISWAHQQVLEEASHDRTAENTVADEATEFLRSQSAAHSGT